MRNDVGVIGLRVLREQAGDHRNADAGADVAGEVVETGAFGPLLRRQRRQRHRAERHEQKAQTGALDQPVDDDRPLRHVRRPAGHLVHRPGREPQANGDKEARIDPAYQLSNDHHGRHRAYAPGPHDEPGSDDRVVHQSLEIGRQQRQRGEVADADNGDEKRSGHKIAVAEKRRPHKGLVRGEGVDEKQIECRGGDDGLDPNLAGTEPVKLLAAVEQDLERADGEAQGTEAEPVQLRAGVPLGLRQEGGDPKQGERTDRQVDVENPPPGVVLGQPAAKHRTEDGADHDRDAK